MANIDQTLGSITYIINIYIGCILVGFGLFGNLLNILVFTQLKLFRRNQSAFYLTTASFVECFQLIFSSSTRLISAISGYDHTRTSIIWCKFRTYIIQIVGIMSVGIICFAAIDQYLSTSYYHQLRQISTFKLAQRHVTILVILASLYSIPFAIYNEIRSSLGCSTYNPSFNYYYSFVHLCIILGIIPVIISSSFSFLSYRNVRRITRRQIPIVRRRLDRQLTAMILVRVALFVITAIPFFTYRIYQINNPITQNSSNLFIAIDQLVRITVTAWYITNYGGSFYIFLISSTRFRRQVRYLFFKKLWRRYISKRVKRNQITTELQMQPTRSRVSSMETN